MAESELSENNGLLEIKQSPEKDDIEPMREEESKGNVEDEAAPRGTEHCQKTEEIAHEEVKAQDAKPAKKTENANEVIEANNAEKQTMNEEQDADENTAEDKPSEIATQEKIEDKQPEKQPEETKVNEKGLGAMVAKHYNERKLNTQEERKTSRIFHLRNFNNWIKSVLINEVMEKYKRTVHCNFSVLDLCCGKGGDLLKWQKARISNLVCADIAEVSVQHCSQRYNDMKYGRNQRRHGHYQTFDAQFITADCTKEDISEKLNGRFQDLKFDITSCQFCFHYAFESPEQAEKMLQNACERLKPGGYFIGTIPCANEIVHRLRQSEDMSFGNECYEILFTEKESISLFGHKYYFHLEGVVDCPEFLVHFPLLEKMASRFGLTLEFAQGFHEFFEEHKNKEEYKYLLNKMNALETYPPRREGDKPTSDKPGAYTQAEEMLNALEDELLHVGTLSKDEWEAAGLYMVFAFKKTEPVPKHAPREAPKPEQPAGKDEKVEEDKAEVTETKVEQGSEEPEIHKNVEEANKIDEEDNKNVEADKKDEGADKKVDDVDKKDEEVNKMNVGGKESEAEVTEAKTQQRSRRTRSLGAAETNTTGEKITPKRGSRKRKSTGGTEEEQPPEKKKI